MTDVFISYSRRDMAFVQQLLTKLKASKKEVWIDLKDIPPTTEWLKEIYDGIEGADNFVLVISPDSLSSQVCGWEINHALKHNKRLIPIVLREVDPDKFLETIVQLGWEGITVEAWQMLNKIHWIFFRETDDFKVSYETLLKSIERYYDHNRMHKNLLVSARSWEQRGCKHADTLRGATLTQAEKWLSISKDKDPQPAPLHYRYIQASRKAATTQRNSIASAVVGGLLIALILLGVALTQFRGRREQQTIAEQEAIARNTQEAIAKNQSILAQASEFAAQSNTALVNLADPQAATLLAIASLNTAYTQEGDTALRTAFSQLPVMFYETDAVTDITYSPDGRFIAYVERRAAENNTEDRIIVLRDALTGDLIKSFGNHASYTFDIAVSPDSLFILTSSGSSGWVWDINTGQNLLELYHGAEVRTVAWSPDGQFMLTGGCDGIARLWNSNGREILAFTHTVSGCLDNVQFSPDGRRILTSGYVDRIHIWNAQTGQELLSLAGHSGSTMSATYSPDGRYVLSGGWDNLARLWDAQIGTELMVFAGHSTRASESGNHVIEGFVTDVAFSPDGKYVLTGSPDRTARLWDITSGEAIRIFQHDTDVTTAIFAPDGRYILTASWGTIRVWQLNFAEPYVFKSTATGFDTEAITGVAYSANGQYIFTIDGATIGHLWDANSRDEVRSFYNVDLITVAFSDDSQYIALGGVEGVEVRSIPRGDTIFSLDSRILYGGNSLRFSPDGQYLLAVESNTAGLWNISTGEKIRTFEVSDQFIKCVAYSPDGQYILVCDGGNARMWKVETGEEVRSFIGHTSGIWGAEFSPDSKYLVTGGTDTIRLWDIETGEELRQFATHDAWIFDVKISPDGRYILAGDMDGLARLWSVETGELIHTYSGHTDWVMGVAFSPDGKYVLTGSRDNTARLWRTHWQDIVTEACARISLGSLTYFRETYQLEPSALICPERSEG
ncbi:MAG: TIR domain-containing protein [Anaerolineae bacterium]|nr:TIR domain-containing protein [Anaerolineae bacterium]